MTLATESRSEMGDDLTWFQRHRMEWIRETLRVFGFINRKHLSRKFEMSIPQAATDLKTFQRIHPGVMKYDPVSMRYIATDFTSEESE
jgi:hypothetical protein